VSDERETAKHVRKVRLGHGANCSSVGSVIDTLFATAVVGTAIYAAVAAALERERKSDEERRKDEDRAREPEGP
jgi:hypothetical protein